MAVVPLLLRNLPSRRGADTNNDTWCQNVSHGNLAADVTSKTLSGWVFLSFFFLLASYDA